VRVHSLTFSYIPRSIRCDSLASLLACTLVNLCLGHEPKVRVATMVKNEMEKENIPRPDNEKKGPKKTHSGDITTNLDKEKKN
jgi:hypothetical protein